MDGGLKHDQSGTMPLNLSSELVGVEASAVHLYRNESRSQGAERFDSPSEGGFLDEHGRVSCHVSLCNEAKRRLSAGGHQNL